MLSRDEIERSGLNTCGWHSRGNVQRLPQRPGLRSATHEAFYEAPRGSRNGGLPLAARCRTLRFHLAFVFYRLVVGLDIDFQFCEFA